MATATISVANLSQRQPVPGLEELLVKSIGILAQGGHQGMTLSVLLVTLPLRLVSIRFQLPNFRVDPLLFGFQADRGFANQLVNLFRLNHLLEDPILDLPDIRLFSLDFLEHRAVLLVRFNLVQLVLVPGDLGSDLLDISLELPPLFLIGGKADLAILRNAGKLIELPFKGLDFKRGSADAGTKAGKTLIKPLEFD